MTELEQAALDELVEVVAGLRGTRFQLLGICSTLPESSAVREIVECVLADAIVPAIRDLKAAVEPLVEGEECSAASE